MKSVLLRKIGKNLLRYWVFVVALFPLSAVALELEIEDPDVVALIQEYEAKAAATPNDAKAQGELGAVYHLHGLTQKAIDQYTKATELDVLEPKWLYYRALLEANTRDVAQAQRTLVRAMNMEPRYGPAWLHRGDWLLELNQPTDALLAFEQALELGSRLAAQVGIARAQLALNNPLAVIDMFEPRLDEQLHPQAIHLLYRAYVMNQIPEKAQQLATRLGPYDPITWEDPWYAELTQYVAESLHKRLDQVQRFIGRNAIEDAVQLTDKLYEQYPQHTAVIFNKAVLAHRMGFHADAAATLQRGIELHPNHYTFYTYLAQIHENLDQVDKALFHLDKAIELDPDEVRAYQIKGYIKMNLGVLEEARLNFAKAYAIDPTDPALLMYYGMTQGLLNNWDKAIELFQEAIDRQPRHIAAYLNLARAVALTGDYTQANTLIAQAEAYGAPQQDLATVKRQIQQIKDQHASR